jgi:radical SAM protein with 4Fe4S-binding SPASM domain
VDLQRNMHCEPVIDIGPDLNVWCCFCLSKMWNRHLDEFKDLQEIQAYYRKAMGLYQSRLYPMDECNDCRYRELWGCQGGCLTHAVMKHGELSLDCASSQPSGDGWKSGAVLALSPDVEIRSYDIPDPSYAIYNKVSGLELEVDASFQPLLRSLDGQHSAREVVDQYLADGGPNPPIESAITAFTQAALQQSANELLSNMLHQGFLVERQS